MKISKLDIYVSLCLYCIKIWHFSLICVAYILDHISHRLTVHQYNFCEVSFGLFHVYNIYRIWYFCGSSILPVLTEMETGVGDTNRRKGHRDQQRHKEGWGGGKSTCGRDLAKKYEVWLRDFFERGRLMGYPAERLALLTWDWGSKSFLVKLFPTKKCIFLFVSIVHDK